MSATQDQPPEDDRCLLAGLVFTSHCSICCGLRLPIWRSGFIFRRCTTCDKAARGDDLAVLEATWPT